MEFKTDIKLPKSKDIDGVPEEWLIEPTQIVEIIQQMEIIPREVNNEMFEGFKILQKYLNASTLTEFTDLLKDIVTFGKRNEFAKDLGIVIFNEIERNYLKNIKSHTVYQRY